MLDRRNFSSVIDGLGDTCNNSGMFFLSTFMAIEEGQLYYYGAHYTL